MLQFIYIISQLTLLASGFLQYNHSNPSSKLYHNLKYTICLQNKAWNLHNRSFWLQNIIFNLAEHYVLHTILILFQNPASFLLVEHCVIIQQNAKYYVGKDGMEDGDRAYKMKRMSGNDPLILWERMCVIQIFVFVCMCMCVW